MRVRPSCYHLDFLLAIRYSLDGFDSDCICSNYFKGTHKRTTKFCTEFKIDLKKSATEVIDIFMTVVSRVLQRFQKNFLVAVKEILTVPSFLRLLHFSTMHFEEKCFFFQSTYSEIHYNLL